MRIDRGKHAVFTRIEKRSSGRKEICKDLWKKVDASDEELLSNISIGDEADIKGYVVKCYRDGGSKWCTDCMFRSVAAEPVCRRVICYRRVGGGKVNNVRFVVVRKSEGERNEVKD